MIARTELWDFAEFEGFCAIKFDRISRRFGAFIGLIIIKLFDKELIEKMESNLTTHHVMCRDLRKVYPVVDRAG